MFRQYVLVFGAANNYETRVCWIDRDPALRPGDRIVLKGRDARIWRVEHVLADARGPHEGAVDEVVAVQGRLFTGT